MSKISIDLNKAKQAAHRYRRAARLVELKPLDDVVAKQIPGKSAADAETERQKIRKRYDEIQLEIDNTADVKRLKSLLMPILSVLKVN